MRLWQRASGVLKDQNSIWLANLTRRNALRNPDIEKAVIHATSHHELSFDHGNIDRVCQWLLLSPLNLKPILWSVSNRVKKTRSWIVALKCLYLMHNVTNSKIPCVRKIGRLPFDLSNFTDGHSRQAKTWSFNEFIRAYYTFLDQKSTLLFQQTGEKGEGLSRFNGFESGYSRGITGSSNSTIMQELVLLQKLQALIDRLMQIKPQSKAARFGLILDVMDGIIIEICDIYSRICRGIASVLLNIYSAGKTEATMALNVVHKAIKHGEDLACYFEFCQEIGVLNTSELPVINKVPEEGIHELEQIINGFSHVSNVDESTSIKDAEQCMASKLPSRDNGEVQKENDEKAIVVRGADETNKENLKTVITDKWEKFDEDFGPKKPFATPPLQNGKNQELPDLISFL